MRTGKTSVVTVWTVLYDGAGAGAAGDGTHVARFGKRAAAEEFAARSTCYNRPATAHPQEVSRATARRWGVA